VVQPADSRKCDDFARARWFDGARDRRIAVDRHMGPILVVVGHVLADQAEQMPLPNHDEVIE
jgi:hypothetical protein